MDALLACAAVSLRESLDHTVSDGGETALEKKFLREESKTPVHSVEEED